MITEIRLYVTDKTDHDSMASKREAVAKAERAFKLFDKDNDGYITKEEFQKISKKLNKQQARPNRIAVIAFSNSLFLIELGNDILCFHLMKQKFYNNILKMNDYHDRFFISAIKDQ